MFEIEQVAWGMQNISPAAVDRNESQQQDSHRSALRFSLQLTKLCVGSQDVIVLAWKDGHSCCSGRTTKASARSLGVTLRHVAGVVLGAPRPRTDVSRFAVASAPSSSSSPCHTHQTQKAGCQSVQFRRPLQHVR